jgi:hypothetical protein
MLICRKPTYPMGGGLVHENIGVDRAFFQHYQLHLRVIMRNRIIQPAKNPHKILAAIHRSPRPGPGAHFFQPVGIIGADGGGKQQAAAGDDSIHIKLAVCF